MIFSSLLGFDERGLNCFQSPPFPFVAQVEPHQTVKELLSVAQVELRQTEWSPAGRS